MIETAVYYTFSTIAQTLGGAIALLAAFVLYRLQMLNSEIAASAAHVRSFACGNTRHWMDIALLQGRPEEILALASRAEPSTLPGIGGEQIKASQDRLAALQVRKASLSRRFGVALSLTVTLVAFAVVVLSLTPAIVRWRVVGPALGLGVVWCCACLVSYVLVVKRALE